MGLVFNNDGTVEIDSGTLSLGTPSPVPYGSATSGGAFHGVPGTTLNFESTNVNLTGTSSISVPNVSFQTGVFNVAGTYAVADQTLILTAGHVNFTGTVTSVGTSLDIVAPNGNASANFSPATPTTLTTNECTITAGLTGSDSLVINGTLTLAGSFARIPPVRSMQRAACSSTAATRPVSTVQQSTTMEQPSGARRTTSGPATAPSLTTSQVPAWMPRGRRLLMEWQRRRSCLQ